MFYWLISSSLFTLGCKKNVSDFGFSIDCFQSPDGCTVASAAGDETLRFWNVFGTPEVAKPAAKTASAGPFAHINHIRWRGFRNLWCLCKYLNWFCLFAGEEETNGPNARGGSFKGTSTLFYFIIYHDCYVLMFENYACGFSWSHLKKVVLILLQEEQMNCLI